MTAPEQAFQTGGPVYGGMPVIVTPNDGCVIPLHRCLGDVQITVSPSGLDETMQVLLRQALRKNGPALQ